MSPVPFIRTSKTRARLSRRAFLRSVGASAALIPLLEAERALGAAAFPKRIITIAWGNGVAQPSFYPPGDDPTAAAIMQPLAPLKAKVTLVAGLDFKGMLDDKRTYDGHFSYPSMFTGTYKNIGGQNGAATGPSIDQVVSDSVAKTVNLPTPLINIAVQGKSTSFRMDGTRNTGETNVARMYKTLFSSIATPMPQLSALTARRKSIIDYIAPELTGFGAKLGTADKAKLAGHLDSIRQLEKGLTAATPGVACTPVDPGAPTEYQASVKAFSDLVAMALRCDVTRAVSITWADDGGSGPYTMPFLMLNGTTMMDVGEVHGIAHEGSSGYPKKIKIDTWYMQQLAYLATALDGTMEGAGTLLDNSLIVMGNDMSEGSFHSVSNIPFVLVGSAGGALRTGRTVKVGTWATKTGNYWSSGNTGVAHNRLLASISNFMDIPSTGFGTGYPGTLTELA
jgi:Protein of unknown function (DUF1552)